MSQFRYFYKQKSPAQRRMKLLCAGRGPAFLSTWHRLSFLSRQQFETEKGSYGPVFSQHIADSGFRVWGRRRKRRSSWLDRTRKLVTRVSPLQNTIAYYYVMSIIKNCLIFKLFSNRVKEI
jgi:hypothetical protein